MYVAKKARLLQIISANLEKVVEIWFSWIGDCLRYGIIFLLRLHMRCLSPELWACFKHLSPHNRVKLFTGNSATARPQDILRVGGQLPLPPPPKYIATGLAKS